VHAANGAHLSDMTGRAARMALGGQCGFGMRLPRRRDDACMRARRYRHRPSGRQRAALHLHGAGARPRYMHRGQDHSAHVSDRRLATSSCTATTRLSFPRLPASRPSAHYTTQRARLQLPALPICVQLPWWPPPKLSGQALVWSLGQLLSP
jgi:hypothetical protein